MPAPTEAIAQTEAAAPSVLRLTNSMSRTVEDFVPIEPGRVRIYVCGMTVYDYCHIGHARAMVTFDLVVRWLTQRGFDVTYARNHTDVDDKIIARAHELGEDPLALSARFIAELDKDLDRLGLLKPTFAPKVSDHIGGIIAMVDRLIHREHAYAVGDGDVYFDVESFAAYGQLSGKKLDDQRAGERVQVDTRKRHPSDFALWKSAKEGEVAWDAPWGRGRPGWHIECSAMSAATLGDRFDIHGGGIDLIFPHHENEIAQSECATDQAPMARYWMHNGHVTMGETKMSKSLGNFVRIRDILEQVPAEALRLLYAESHYRSPLPFSSDRLMECVVALDRLYHAREVLETMAAEEPLTKAKVLLREYGETARELHRHGVGFPAVFGAAMDDDFNTAAAVGHLFELVRAINRFGNNRKWLKRSSSLSKPGLQAFKLDGRVLGVGALTSAEWFSQVRSLRLAAIGKTEADIEAQIEARLTARADRDWAAADQIRDELSALGVVLMDGAEATQWRMKVD
jgi:cysteinyl-tRNA synthetase